MASKPARFDRIIASAEAVPGTRARREQLGEQARSMEAALKEACPVSRELSLALTRLEETLLWAYAAIACPTETETEAERKR